MERYALRTLGVPEANVPVVMGTLWLAGMDNPQRDRDGRWWICRNTSWASTAVRGGHAYCLEPQSGNDQWAEYHDQQRGSCTGHSGARCMELFNRRRFDPEDLYERAQQIDEWADTPPEEGSSVRAAFDVLRTQGPRRVSRNRTAQSPLPEDGVAANRWATSADEILGALGHDGAAPILQSWGLRRRGSSSGWPHRVWISGEALGWLLERDGEATIPVDA